jgi:transketolase
VIRPADALETAQAWRQAILSNNGPTALILSRQKLPIIDPNLHGDPANLTQGAYVLADSAGKPDIVLIATGSEVHIASEARQRLIQNGVSARVVSMPSWELFEKTSREYKESVLPSDVPRRVAVEAGLPLGWERYVGAQGVVIGMHGFGASAPGNTLLKNFGFSAENIVETAMKMLE